MSLLAERDVLREVGAPEGFIAIDLATLRIDSELDFDLYIATHAGKEPTLYRERDLAFAASTRDRLVANRVDTLYVLGEDERHYYRYMERHLESILQDDDVSTSEKTRILYDTSLHMVEHFIENPEARDMLPRTRQVVDATVGYLQTEQGAFQQFLKTAPLDYQTYTHSVNVSVYSLTLAQKLGYTDPRFLRDLGAGTLLHDIGKSRIPRAILDKPGSLTDEEWTIMKKHPEWGYELLLKQGVTSTIVLEVTRDHHEKLDGSGYPRRLLGNAIHDHARITTVCDIFDALTTKRCYKEAERSFNALSLMKREMGGQLDPAHFETFVGLMAGKE